MHTKQKKSLCSNKRNLYWKKKYFFLHNVESVCDSWKCTKNGTKEIKQTSITKKLSVFDCGIVWGGNDVNSWVVFFSDTWLAHSCRRDVATTGCRGRRRRRYFASPWQAEGKLFKRGVKSNFQYKLFLSNHFRPCFCIDLTKLKSTLFMSISFSHFRCQFVFQTFIQQTRNKLQQISNIIKPLKMK